MRTATAMDLTAAMEVDNPGPGEMSMAMEVDNSPPPIVPGLPNLVPDSMPETQVNAPPPPLLTQTGRPRQGYRLPKRFRDNLPEPPAPAPTTSSSLESNTNPVRRVILIVRDRLVTVMNSFGIWRDYPERPSVDPDSHLTLEDLSNSYHHSHLQSHASLSETHSSESESRPSYWPFLNGTVHGVMQWLNNGQILIGFC
jgi:hypothetical protein